MTVEIVPVRYPHVLAVWSKLRALERSSGTTVQMILQEIDRSVVSYAGLVDGECVAVWGARASTPISDVGYVWLICSHQIEYLPIAFLRHSRIALEELKKQFKVLYGLVDMSFGKSVRWLQWLGFEIKPYTEMISFFVMEP